MLFVSNFQIMSAACKHHQNQVANHDMAYKSACKKQRCKDIYSYNSFYNKTLKNRYRPYDYTVISVKFPL